MKNRELMKYSVDARKLKTEKYKYFQYQWLASFILIIMVYGMPITATAQPLAPGKGDIKVVARPLNDSILIRWAPLNFSTWRNGNDYGYNIVRYTLIRDSLLLEKPEFTKLNHQPLKPLPLNDWEKYVHKNKYAAIAAQAIYGSSFETDGGPGLNPSAAYNKSVEQQQRLSFALFSADISPEVAQISGLWFTDQTAKKNEKYLYRVMVDIPSTTKVKIDTGYVFTSISEFHPLPPPVELRAEFGDRIAQISWNAFAQNNVYMAWWVERSEDGGKSFKKIHNDPLTQIITDHSLFPELIYKTDSLPQNNKEYTYRVRGVSSFGEVGPYSTLVQGKGAENIKAAPVIIGNEIIGNHVKLQWDFPKDQERTISGFQILRSDNHKTNFKPIAKVASAERLFLDKVPLGTGYYKIMAWKESVTSKESYPVLVQLTDSIPPAIPIGLKGTADTLGLVRLSWVANKENDLYGYRVFRSVSGVDEYSLVTSKPVTEPFFTDTLNKMDLNRKVFYKIMAVDQRQNESDFSTVLAVEKPDIFPPSSPVFKSIKATEKGIELQWVNSSSDDLESHVLYRRFESDTIWTIIQSFKPVKKQNETIYTDKLEGVSEEVTYRVVAMDYSGNLSAPAQSIPVQPMGNPTMGGIKRVGYSYDAEKGKLHLNWTKPNGDVKQIIVYRETSDKAYSKYETLTGPATTFEDYGMKAGSTYSYRLRVVYQDGSVSGFSNEVRVRF